MWEINHGIFKPTVELVGITTIAYVFRPQSGEKTLQKFLNGVFLSQRDIIDLQESNGNVDVKSRSNIE